MYHRLTSRKEVVFFAALPKAAPGLAIAWWSVLLLRGTLPAAFAIAMGVLVGAVQRGAPLQAPLVFAGASFVLLLWRWIRRRARSCGCSVSPAGRSTGSSRDARALQYAATRLRERPVVWSVLLVVSANVLVFWSLASAATEGRISLGEVVVYVQMAIGVSMIAFGGFSWALDGAAAPVAAVLRLEPAMRPAGAPPSGSRSADALPAREIRLRNVTFAYPTTSAASVPVLEHFDLTIPAGTSLAIVGQNGAGKTTIAKLLCRLYDPQSGAIEIDGVDLRDLDLASWRSRVAAVFQDFIRFELPLRDNVAPAGAPDDVVRSALALAGAASLAELDTVLARGYSGGTELSGGQWQRIALR